jgi:uncharacterized protein (TIGR02118 family)
LFAVIALLRKSEEMNTEEWRSWWREEHVPTVLKNPGLRHYAIYPIEEKRVSVDPNEWSTQDLPYDGLAIIYFDSREAFMAAQQTQEGVDDKLHLRTGTADVLVLHAGYEAQLPWAGPEPAPS